jgi:hypothetical protein
VVARGWALACEVWLVYAIGQAAPVAVDFDTFGTGDNPAVRYAGLGVDIAGLVNSAPLLLTMQSGLL